jgi:hypothetical protein
LGLNKCEGVNNLKKGRMPYHVDANWINEKINCHGGGFSFRTSHGLAIIHFIGNKNRIQLFGYNIVLFFKFLFRILKNNE